MRAVSLLTVQSADVWDELAAATNLEAHVEERTSLLSAIVRPSFAADALPELQGRGVEVLVRYARRPPETAERDAVVERVHGLPADALRVLHSAQSHARDGRVRGFHAWDPLHDADAVGLLHAAGLLSRAGGSDWGAEFQLHRDLPPPPAPSVDFSEAVMEETDDLSAPESGPAALLQDMAGLAAAIAASPPKKTHAGSLARADARKLGRRLGIPQMAEDGLFETQPRWVRALQGLEALGAVSMDPLKRLLFLDLGIEELLGGGRARAVDRLVRRLVPWDLHPLLHGVREALRQAGPGALDEPIFIESLREQARELQFPAWNRGGLPFYPHLEDERPRPFDDHGWETIEERLIEKTLKLCTRLGVVRRAPGIFAATDDGRVWAEAEGAVPASLWCGSDLEIVVPPGALTPWERFQLERITVCLGRDVVDRHRLDRDALVGWLATHEIDEALGLLERRCLALPRTAVEALQRWDARARRVVLTRGVLLD